MHPPSRRGTTLMELAASLAMLAAIVVLVGHALRLASAQHSDAERRQLALQEAANCLERTKLIPFPELSPDSLHQVALSAEGMRSLPGGELSVKLHEDPALAPAKRLTAEVRWKTGAGAIDNKVQLVAIVFP